MTGLCSGTSNGTENIPGTKRAGCGRRNLVTDLTFIIYMGSFCPTCIKNDS